MLRTDLPKLPFVVAFLWGTLLFSPARAQVADSLPPEVEMVEEEVILEEEEEAPFLFRSQTLRDSMMVSARSVREADVVKLREDEDFWYVNEAPKREAPRKPFSFRLFDKAWFKTLMWILVGGGFLVILVWFLISSNVQLFQKKSGTIGGTAVGEEEEENIFAIDYDSEIRKAVVSNDLRLAIRLHYLQLLKDLAQAGAIRYSPGSTNSDYVLQLHGQPNGAEFFQLTRTFEYSWYGQFPISKEAFTTIETRFSNLRSRLLA